MKTGCRSVVLVVACAAVLVLVGGCLCCCGDAPKGKDPVPVKPGRRQTKSDTGERTVSQNDNKVEEELAPADFSGASSNGPAQEYSSEDPKRKGGKGKDLISQPNGTKIKESEEAMVEKNETESQPGSQDTHTGNTGSKTLFQKEAVGTGKKKSGGWVNGKTERLKQICPKSVADAMKEKEKKPSGQK